MGLQTFTEYLLQEKLITLGGKMPKYGQVVIMAGGAGQVGFIKDQLLGIDGKVFDVDALKSLALKSTLYARKVKNAFGIDLKDMDLKNQDNVSTLHKIVSELGIAKKNQQAMFSSIMNSSEETKPNLIFDVTMKDMKKLINITDDVRKLGYKNENIHIVWVVNSVDTALKQNMERDRKVNPDILKDTHRGVSQTIRHIIDDAPDIQKYMDGDFWVVFNNRFMKDVVMVSSGKGGSFIKDAMYTKIKKQHGRMLRMNEIDKDVLAKIKSYVPKQKLGTINMTFDELLDQIDITKEIIDEATKEKRYVVTLEMYMWDKDDRAVIKQAEKLASDLKRKYDNQCSVDSIVEQPHGSMGNRKVK